MAEAERSGSERRVLVVGGGIAGICAAWSLAERGYRVELLERDPYSPGGRVASHPPTRFRYGGREWVFPIEHGVHGWWRQYQNFLSLIDSLGLSGRLIDAYDQTVVFYDGQNVYRTNVGRETQITPVPEPIHHLQLLLKRNIQRMMKPREIPLLTVLGAKILESVVFDPTSEDHRQRYDRLSILDYMRGVPYFYQAFLRSLSRSGFFSDPQYVSLWAYFVALQHYVFLSRSDQRFAFCRGPIVESLLQPLLDRIERRGGRIRLGVDVRKVERLPGGGWRVEARRTPEKDSAASGGDRSGGDRSGDETQVYETPELVMAVDVGGAHELLRTSPDLAPAYGDISVFKGRRATSIRIWWARSPSERWGDSGVVTGRATVDSYFWVHRFQDACMRWHLETGGSVCECHLYAPPYKHDLSDAELYRRVRDDMCHAFPELEYSAVHHAIIRNPATHTNFPVGCARSFPPVRTPMDDLVLCGDWTDGGVPVLYMERACQTGLLAANILLERAGLPPRTIRNPLPPPTHMQALQRLLRAVDRVAPGVWPTGPRASSDQA